MKGMLKKYKIPLISGGVLLSIIVSSSMINFDSPKQNIDENKAKLEIYTGTNTSQANIIKDKQIERDKEDREDQREEVVKKTYNDKNKDNYEKEKDIKEKSEDTNKTANIINKTEKATNNLENNNIEIKEKVQLTKTKEKDVNKKSLSNIEEGNYTTKKGDTLFLIAQDFDLTVDHLIELNNLNSDIIYENQTLKIEDTVSDSFNHSVSRGNERSEDLYWLSRVIHAEAQGESYKGMLAVGNVIINRADSHLFPDTIKGVVFDKQNGYTQFSPVIDGSIHNTPDAESIKAAKEILAGARPVGKALYFLNPRKSTNFWIENNRKYMKTIGLHDFYY